MTSHQLPRPELEAILQALLQQEATCFLATCDPDSHQPRVAPVHYFVDPLDPLFRLYILSDEGTAKLHNIKNNDRVSVAVCDTNRAPADRRFSSCRGLQVTGTAKVIPASPASDERHQAMRVYKWEEYAKEVGLTAPPTQSFIVVTPTKMELLDLTPAFKAAHPGVSPGKQVWTLEE